MPFCRPLFLDRFQRRIGRVSFPLLAVIIAQLAGLPPLAMALPTGGQLIAGQVTTTVNGTQLTLDQASRAAIMNWSKFNIAPNELVRVLQHSKDAALLARVTGGDPSQLLGTLHADGKIFLINPRGILVGQGAIIDTAAFMASTLDVADADFLQGGGLTFQGDSTAGVVNLGRITAREGNVFLVAHTVKNAGEISAANGTAGLGAGTEVYLASPDAPAFVIKTNLPATPEKTGVDNSGVISAAQAQLEAAGGSIYDLAVNHSGSIRATGVEHRPDGRILLTAAAGTVLVTGSAQARDASGQGGEILVGGDYQGKNSAVANAARTRVAAGAVLDASAASARGEGGRVIVWADDTTRFDGAIIARAGAAGGDGGFAEVSGKRALAFNGTSDLSAAAGQRGTLLLDPDNITIVAGSTTPPAGIVNGPPVSWYESADPGSHNFGADNLTGLLANNSVHLMATDTITVNAPVVVATGGTPGMQLSFSASTIALNQTVSLANVTDGTLDFYHGGTASGTSLTTAAGATIAASRIRVGSFPIVALNGPVSTPQLIYYGPGAATSLSVTNPANAIAHLVLNTDPADPQALNYSGNVAVHSSTAMDVSAMIGAANNVTFSSAGNLTLRNDDLDVSTITASGTTTLASTGGVLVNQAGANLLSGTGRRLLYTSDVTGAFTLGGLTGYTQVDGVSYPNDPNSAVTLVLYNAAGGGPALVLTITANDFIKLYGQPDPAFTASYAGGTAADLTTLPSFSIQQGAHVNVGTYTIVPSGAASGTHTLQYVNGTLQIDPATLTYLANTANRLYGDANPGFSGTITGFVNGDTIDSATTGTLAFASPATAASNAGSYAINGGGLTANHGNYVFQDAVANFSALTVSKAPLTVAFDDATRTYGAANPAFTATFTGLRNGDTPAALAGFSVFTSATAASSVGTYRIEGGATATNYAITSVPGTLTITPAPLTLTGASVSTEYGTPGNLGYTVTGLLQGDSAAVLSGVAVGSAFFDNTPVGSYTYGFSNKGTAQNYVVTTVVPGTYTVTRAPLTLAGTNLSMVYGNTPPPLGYTVSGLKLNDTAAVLSGVGFDTAFFTGTLPGSHSYGFSNTGTAANYQVTKVLPGTLTVDRIPYHVTSPDIRTLSLWLPANFPYDAPAQPAGAPHFSVQLMVAGMHGGNKYGTYSFVPTIIPAADTTLFEIQKYYDISYDLGKLIIAFDPIDLAVVTMPPDYDSTLIVNNTAFDPTNLSVIKSNFNLDTGTQVKVGLSPLLTAAFGDALLKGSVSGYQKRAQHPGLVADLVSGKVSPGEFLYRAQKDPAAKQVVKDLLFRAMNDLLLAGEAYPPGLAAVLPSVIDALNEPNAKAAAAAKERYQKTLAEINPGEATIAALYSVTPTDIQWRMEQAKQEYQQALVDLKVISRDLDSTGLYRATLKYDMNISKELSRAISSVLDQYLSFP